MNPNLEWFQQFKSSPTTENLKKNPIAYFCAEYALTNNLPSYAGGLGVLAGDLIREANDRHFPLVAVGLYYNDGYETLHKIDEKGYIDAPHVHKQPESFGLEQVADAEGKPITVTIPIEDRQVTVKAYLWHVGTIPVYLLTTDTDENSAQDRKITDHLYVVDRQTRLKQEIVLGIGGARFLEKLQIEPSLFHMNEGHSGLLALEVIKKYIQDKKLTFEEAVNAARKKIAFTNHTLVIGGQEIFSNDLVSLTLNNYANELGVPLQTLTKLGEIKESNSFSLTMFSLQTAGHTNAVSQIHAKVAKEIWKDFNVISITNGIHIPFWNSIADDTNIWDAHLENKRALLAKINLQKGKSWDANDLIIGWARRLVSYKRPMAIFEDIEALRALLSDTTKPFKIVLSGNLHPSDVEAAEALTPYHKIIEEFSDHMVFIPEYDLDIAHLMTAGCDIWVNTPIVGFEACGTSGMKAALNGNLPVSTRDGWVAEIELLNKGWALEDDHVNESFMKTLKDEILPLYYNRDENNVPLAWTINMKNSRELIKNEFSATRMLREYIEKLYMPLLA